MDFDKPKVYGVPPSLMVLFTLPYTLKVGTQEDAYKKSYLFIDICFGVFAINTAAVYISNYALRSILHLRI